MAPVFFRSCGFLWEISMVFFRLRRNFMEFMVFDTLKRRKKKKRSPPIANPKKKALISGGRCFSRGMGKPRIPWGNHCYRDWEMLGYSLAPCKKSSEKLRFSTGFAHVSQVDGQIILLSTVLTCGGYRGLLL